MAFLASLYYYFFGTETNKSDAPIIKTLLDIKHSISALRNPNLPISILQGILYDNEKVYHSYRKENVERVSTGYWDQTKLVVRLEDEEAQHEFASLTDFGIYHYTQNKESNPTCRGFKDCYVIREGRRWQIYELLP
jgi:hypothetical protein